MALLAADGSASDVDDRTEDMLYRDARLRSDCRDFRAQPEADPESTDWAKFRRVPFDTSSRLLPAVLRCHAEWPSLYFAAVQLSERRVMRPRHSETSGLCALAHALVLRAFKNYGR